jgi:beta-glucosidase-like glycosyl hydrolase
MDKCNISALLAEPFQGFVISDWQGIDRITYPAHANYTYSVQTSVLAGVDMVSYKS